MRVLIRIKFFPGGYGFVEIGSLRGSVAAFHVVERRLVGGDDAAARAAFDAHIADGHPLFHRQVADRFAGELDKMSRSARRRYLRDDVQDDVFGRHPFAALAVHGDTHRFGLRLQDALRSEYHFDFRRADSECDGAESPVRRGVAVAAYDRHAGLSDPLFGPDDMHDAVSGTAQLEVFHTVLLAVAAERFELFAALFFGNGSILVQGRHVVIRRSGRLLRPGYFDPAVFESQKSDRRGYFMNIMTVDI